PGALHVRPGCALKELDLASGIKFLSVAPDQLRFVIERIDLAGSAGHEELNDALGPSPVMRPAPGSLFSGQEAGLIKQVGQGNAAQSAAGMPEESSAIHALPPRNSKSSILSAFSASLRATLQLRIARRDAENAEASSIDKDELIGVKQQPTAIRQTVL